MTTGITLAPLFALRIAHGYYGAAAVPLAFEPTPETAAALSRGGCRIHVTQDVAQIYAQVPFGAPPARDPETPEFLTFRLMLRDSDFVKVTEPDWGAEAPGDAFSFGPDGVDPEGALPSAAAHSLPVIGRYGRVTLEEPVSGREMALHPLSVPGTGPSWTGRTQPGARHIDLAVPGLPEGAYTLSIDGQARHDLILSDRPPARLYGIVTVPLAGAFPVGPREVPKTITLQFRARASRWRYVLQPRGDTRDLSGARIVKTQSTVGFASPVKATRLGRTVWISESDGQIPLALRPPKDRGVSLVLPAGAGPPEPVRLLPTPGSDNIALERGPDGPEAWATLHVPV